jgi:hypothetical protein
MSTTDQSTTSAFSNSNEAYLFSVESKILEGFYGITSKLPFPWIISLLSLFINLFQVSLLSFSKTFNFGYTSKMVSKYLGYVSRQWIFDETNYTVFQVVMGVSFGIVVVYLLLMVYFTQQEDTSIKKIQKISAAALFILSHLMFVPFLGIFFTSFECNYETSTLWSYSDVQCFLYPNDISIAFCTIGILILLMLSFVPQFL